MNGIKPNETQPKSEEQAKSIKRPICHECSRPHKTCICSSLPEDRPLSLERCRIIVLQHPHEAKLKNRSLPILELCLKQYKTEGMRSSKKWKRNGKEDVLESTSDWSMAVVVGRRLGQQIDLSITDLLNQIENVMLVFPFSYCDDKYQPVLSLEGGLAELNKRQSELASKNNKITIVFVDATWKYAKEMVRVNDQLNLWPARDLVRVKLDPPSEPTGADNSCLTSKAKTAHYTPPGYKPRRFAAVRTPPNCGENDETTSNFLSTAECIAWVISYVENKTNLYDKLMKPLDQIVGQWKHFQELKAKRKVGC